MPDISLDHALGDLGAKSDHDLMLLTTQLVLTIKREDLPAICLRLDHTNGGFKGHEERIALLERVREAQKSLVKAEEEERHTVAQAAVTENNRLQAQLLKKLAWPIAIAMTLGTFIGAIIAPLLEKWGLK